ISLFLTSFLFVNVAMKYELFYELFDVGIKDEDIEMLKAAGVYYCNHLKMYRPKGSTVLRGFTKAKLAIIFEAAEKLMENRAAYGTNAGDVNKRMKSKKQVKTGDSSKELIVKNLAFGYQKSQLVGELKKFGKGVKVESIFQNGMFTGSAKATFESSQDAQKALALNGRMFFRQNLVLERGDNHQDNQIAEQPFVVVKGLPRDITKQQVRDHFTECGVPTKLHLSSGYQHNHRSAFIRYDSQPSIDKALELNGSVLLEQMITVELGKSSGGCPY
ncbi:nucleolin-like protein 2, partial [Tanacetum coccineum]